MIPRTARRGRRLSRSAEFERVYRQGKSVSNRQLVLYAFPNEAVVRPRLGLSVSRKVGGAVERNRVKRLLREAFAEREQALRAGHDIVVVARPEAGELADCEGLEGVAAALGELIEKAGLVADGGDSREVAEVGDQPDSAEGTPEVAEGDSGVGRSSGSAEENR